MVICLQQGAEVCIWPSWCHCLSLSLASVKSRLVLPFWYRLTRVVAEKGPLNGCVCVCVSRYWFQWHLTFKNAAGALYTVQFTHHKVSKMLLKKGMFQVVGSLCIKLLYSEMVAICSCNLSTVGGLSSSRVSLFSWFHCSLTTTTSSRCSCLLHATCNCNHQVTS